MWASCYEHAKKGSQVRVVGGDHELRAHTRTDCLKACSFREETAPDDQRRFLIGAVIALRVVCTERTRNIRWGVDGSGVGLSEREQRWGVGERDRASVDVCGTGVRQCSP